MEVLPYLISRRQFNARRKLTARLAEDIRKGVAISIDGAENVFCIDSKPVKVCQNARAKRCAMRRDNIEAAPDWALAHWVARAGIDKHITWHCARHSFAVNILNNGANIKTVASLLGHSGLLHTEKYTRAVDSLKEAAINSLPGLE